jgi:hypothetical protein
MSGTRYERHTGTGARGYKGRGSPEVRGAQEHRSHEARGQMGTRAHGQRGTLEEEPTFREAHWQRDKRAEG